MIQGGGLMSNMQAKPSRPPIVNEAAKMSSGNQSSSRP